MKDWIEVPTWWARIYLSGPIDVAKQVCREFCMTGLCVTVEPCEFIYTGGQETGYCVGLINYPRFPKGFEQITGQAKELGRLLMERTFQQSALVMTPTHTEWLTTRETNENPSRMDVHAGTR